MQGRKQLIGLTHSMLIRELSHPQTNIQTKQVVVGIAIFSTHNSIYRRTFGSRLETESKTMQAAINSPPKFHRQHRRSARRNSIDQQRADRRKTTRPEGMGTSVSEFHSLSLRKIASQAALSKHSRYFCENSNRGTGRGLIHVPLTDDTTRRLSNLTMTC